MLPYLLVLFGSWVLGSAAQSRATTTGNRQFVWFIIGLILIAFAGLRDVSVGTDTIAYVNRFHLIREQLREWDAGTLEIGIDLIYAITTRWFDNYAAVLLVFAAIAVSFAMTAIRRVSMHPTLSLFLFISFGYYAFHMNGARQGVAIAIYMMALPALIDGRFRTYLLWVLFAAAFHSSALFTLPVYFIARQRYSLPLILLAVTLGALGVVLFDNLAPLLGLINDRYAQYLERTERGGELLTAFHATQGVLFILLRSWIGERDRRAYDCLILLYLFGASIYVLVWLTGSYVEMTRLSLYFTVASVIAWPLIITQIKPQSLHRTSIIFALACFATLYFALYLHQMGSYIPYKPNQTLISSNEHAGTALAT